ncbi:hypothetical protein DERF_005735 [Dermatophagoides farinae]|uniref:Uncharacterized protein n=1 Tax=Dermatophagoides farinae TaxID=6954 RepID=A0A922I7K1_DERFA|nr:hypothetical protein DERF_013568 [Dermatophagoides farinae]KAH9522135.1 hypothetical protein DERF_005735 [Dermatophagoides farinae]
MNRTLSSITTKTRRLITIANLANADQKQLFYDHIQMEKFFSNFAIFTHYPSYIINHDHDIFQKI